MLALVLSLGCAAPASAAGEATPPRKLTFAPHWLPRAEFAGYYVAADRGIYARHGLEVTILSGSTERPPSHLLADGEVDAASLWLTTAIQMRDHGVPLVNVAQLLARSSLLLVAKKSSGIRTPEDLQGRRVGVWGGDFLVQPREFLRLYGVDAELVPLGATINLFLRDGVDATVATWFNEYHTILDSGYEADELTTFFFSEHGVNFPEDGIYIREDALRADPSVGRAFVAATLEGWSYAFDHADEAVDIVMQHMVQAHVGTNASQQRWMLARVHDLMRPRRSAVPVGTLTREDYERTGSALLQSGAIGAVPAYEDFYRPLISAP